MRFKKLIVYQKSFELAMLIFEKTKAFPKIEQYSLTDQIRRSSRSVCSNFAESYYKRTYLKHFVSKLSDARMENAETLVWLDFSYNCNYISTIEYKELSGLQTEIGKLLTSMIQSPEKFT